MVKEQHNKSELLSDCMQLRTYHCNCGILLQNKCRPMPNLEFSAYTEKKLTNTLPNVAELECPFSTTGLVANSEKIKPPLCDCIMSALSMTSTN